MEIDKWRRRDYEIYYLRWMFQDYFKQKNTSHEEYIYEEFLEWAKKDHPLAEILIGEYQNPFPQIYGKETALQEIDQNKETAKPAQSNFLKVRFIVGYGPKTGLEVPKKLPVNTDMLYLRSWASQTFKIADKNSFLMKFKNPNSKTFEDMDVDLTKDLNWYGVVEGAEILIEENL